MAQDLPVPRGIGAMSHATIHVYRAVRWGGDLCSKWDGSIDESSEWRTSCQCGWESNPCVSVSSADDAFRAHSGQPYPRNRISSDQIALTAQHGSQATISSTRVRCAVANDLWNNSPTRNTRPVSCGSKTLEVSVTTSSTSNGPAETGKSTRES